MRAPMASIDRLYGVGFRELVQGAADEDGVELALEEQPRQVCRVVTASLNL